jgi:hypothetical protein
VRDALGLVRLLFAVEREGIDIDRTTLLAEVGTTLGQCLEMGHLRPESLGYRAAVDRSAAAMERLVAVTWSADVAELVRHARDRVCGVRPPNEGEREERRKAGAVRR